ncbi:MAG: hypothetical protein AB7P21_27560 [Lautropia sp.]
MELGDDHFASSIQSAAWLLVSSARAARAQLVTAVAERFDHDAARLRQVRSEIDRPTSASCPGDRADMLRVPGTKTLAEAVA